MKNIYLLTCLLFSGFGQIMAQTCDTLLLNDGSSLTVTITKYQDGEIYYEYCPSDNSVAPSLRMLHDDFVRQIRYGSGETRAIDPTRRTVAHSKPNLNTFYAGIGCFSVPRTRIWSKTQPTIDIISLVFDPNYNWETVKRSGTPLWILGYQRHLSSRVAAGMEVSGESYHVQGYKGGAYFDTKFNIFSCRGSLRAIWGLRKNSLFYSGVSLGIGFIKASNELPEYLENIAGVQPAFSFVPIGIQLGRPVGLNLEFAPGWSGFFNLSMRADF